jgi:hypothetical protein
MRKWEWMLTICRSRAWKEGVHLFVAHHDKVAHFPVAIFGNSGQLNINSTIESPDVRRWTTRCVSRLLSWIAPCAIR